MRGLYKHIFCDLDNTLFGKNLVVSDIVVDAIKIISDRVGFSICTARGSTEAFPLLTRIHLTSPQIVENGATVMQPDGTILRRVFLSEADSRKLMTCLDKYKIWKKVCIDGNMLDFDSVTDYSQITKVALQDLNEEMYQEIDKELSSFTTLFYAKSHAAHKPGFLTMDISNIESTKQEAIFFVMKKLGLKKEELIGIGDSYNDYPLLMACGLKVAVGNAVSEIKEIADFIAPSVDENGVAAVIKKYFS